MATVTWSHDVRVTELKMAVVILPSCFGGKNVAVPFCGILESWDE
jgi:hypothetical protein